MTLSDSTLQLKVKNKGQINQNFGKKASGTFSTCVMRALTLLLSSRAGLSSNLVRFNDLRTEGGLLTE